jgi:hypothetical protein
MRDDFPKVVIDVVARRAGMRCSFPSCRQLTSGPRSEHGKAISIGVAAHITAASPGGPRYDETLPSEDRASAVNGIWLCQNHAKLIDNDEIKYTAAILRAWKAGAEEAARAEVTGESVANPGAVAVASMSRSADPEEACIEFLRLENLQMPREQIGALFGKAIVMTDGAGERAGWEVFGANAADASNLPDVLDFFASRSPQVRREHRLARHDLAVVSYGKNACEGERLALTLMEELREQIQVLRVRVLFGFVAYGQFTGIAMTGG